MKQNNIIKYNNDYYLVEYSDSDINKDNSNNDGTGIIRNAGKGSFIINMIRKWKNE